jgi:hypothetical protein
MMTAGGTRPRLSNLSPRTGMPRDCRQADSEWLAA